MNDVLTPAPALLCKLGSIIVHTDEMLSPHGHSFDAEALKALMADPDVQAWITDMGALAMVPLKRNL